MRARTRTVRTTYTVTDATTLPDPTANVYTVTVTVTPASTAKVMSNVCFPGYGYAWESDGTGFNLLMVVPSSTNITALAPTFSVSEFATSSPASGDPLDFSTPVSKSQVSQARKSLPPSFFCGFFLAFTNFSGLLLAKSGNQQLDNP